MRRRSWMYERKGYGVGRCDDGLWRGGEMWMGRCVLGCGRVVGCVGVGASVVWKVL